ncbi:phosphodiester glycosidase family protein [Nitratireductor aquimarinus]|uniref:phosphodiester glycosidase family protein n=1 Tax=Alphaproteobacteria TaxID=28211 RepID=UPI0019D401BF|nr:MULTISPECIES: phosphodiester glycosidase family protein [Alphaproteobacteria]MBN7755546.1 phosphodiester glycosidase family protein [Nitratireductor aquimarinus]MBY5998300.1 phosphodiester glycosidase family protein [Tritonibacter mobilis]MBY6020331.1 phosphodiester glycosidase family protein [Nitratireductor sp. DP7N14-4]
MSIFSKLGALIFAPTDAAGNPRQVINHDAQVWSTEVERIIQVALEGGDLLVYSSLSALNADLDHPAHTGAILIGVSIADDGLYMKQGASGSGSWVKIGNVPGQGFVKATNAGAGTANAIAATTPVAVNETQLILLPITAANTASPVTVAFNGGAALTVKTVSGNDVAAGGLPAGSVMLGVVQGGDFRLLSDQASAGIQAAAEAAQVAAEAVLAEMREKSVGAFPDNASADAFLTAEGLTKQKGTIYFNTTADVWRYWDGSAWQTFPYSIVADGGVTEEKLGDGAVVEAKLANESVSGSKLADGAVTEAKLSNGLLSALPRLTGSASVRHVRDGTYIYDVIELSSPFLLNKEFAPNAAPDGVVDRVTAREYSKLSGRKVVINADGWRNADGSPGAEKLSARPMGLQIANGILYQDWQAAEHRDQAIVMMSNGNLVKALKGSKTGAEWIADGAVWSVSWGVVCVENGAAVNVDGTYVGTDVSARTVLGQKQSGEIVIVLVEGISGSYGATGTQAGQIAEALGCEIAYICDGGGSSQAWWKNTYAVPSSDTAGNYPTERGVPSFLVFDANVGVEEYDSGLIEVPLAAGYSAMGSHWGIGLRHKGPQINASVRISGTFTDNSEPQIGQAYPYRYHSTFDGLTRFVASGNGGRQVGVYAGSSKEFRAGVHNLGTNPTYVAGSGYWPAPFTDLDIVDA